MLDEERKRMKTVPIIFLDLSKGSPFSLVFVQTVM